VPGAGRVDSGRQDFAVDAHRLEDQAGEAKKSPLVLLIVSAFATLSDVRGTLNAGNQHRRSRQ
jgi:hypothetical protein